MVKKTVGISVGVVVLLALAIIVGGYGVLVMKDNGFFRFGSPPPLCQNDIYAVDCVCDEGLVKKTFSNGGVLRQPSTCEPFQLFIDPDEEGFEELALQYAKDQLNRICPQSNMNDCPDDIAYTEAQWSWPNDNGRRLVYVPCYEKHESGESYREWTRIMFFLDNGELWDESNGAPKRMYYSLSRNADNSVDLGNSCPER